MTPRRTAHVDTFVLDHMPPPELRPAIDLSGVADLGYPDVLNAAGLLLDHWIASGNGTRPALHHSAGTWTYQRLFETANRIAHMLVDDCSLVPGGRVLLRGANQPMLVACWLAVLKAGGIAVTTMPLLRERELADIISQGRIGLAIADDCVAADLRAAIAMREGARVVCFNSAAPDGLEAMMAEKPSTFANVATDAEDPAIVAFTSGTTGRGKGTVHSHRDLLAVADTYGRHVLQPEAGDIFIGTPPIAFTYALGGLVLFPLRAGASSALVEQMSPPVLLEKIQEFHATIAFTSPTAYRAMVGQASAFDLSSLRKCVSAGETLPAATFEAWEKATGIRLMDGIGSTEMLHVFIGCRAADARPGATGKVVPGYRARIVDEQGDELPFGTVGRLAVQGPTGCRYLADLENQKKYVQGGWNLTGDAYRQDADGYFHYEARTDDLIVSSGYNISGVEVENVLLTHPAVAECAVIGAPDEARGQLVKAFIVLAAGRAGDAGLTRELQDFVKAQIAPYKYPRAIEYASELPRTPTGKLQRYRLRAAAASPAASHARPEELRLHEPEGWARPAGYANAVSAEGRLVFVSGQIGWDPATSTFANDGFAAEVRQALMNVAAALDAAGARCDQITRLTWYITDRDAYVRDRKAIGTAYREVIGRHYPAMSVVIVAALVEPEAHVEIEATAVV
jgi:2-aminobenzoate-CoA ligase